MVTLRIILRLFYFPLGFLNQLKVIGVNGSRDYFNRNKFKRSIIDNGCCIDEKSIIHPNVHLLEKCIVNSSEINSYTYLGKKCLVQNATIGKFCSIANEVLIGLGSHPLYLVSTSPLFYKKKNPLQISLLEKNLEFIEYKPISIGNDVWIGTRAIIMGGVSIGHGAVIAANAVVTEDIPPYAIAVGVPAKIIKYRFTSEKIIEMVKSKWWEMDLVEILKKNRV